MEAHQKRAVDGVRELLDSSDPRKVALLYYSMGTGKTLTGIQVARNASQALLCDSVFVIAPPSTNREWDKYLKAYVSVPWKVVSHRWVTLNADYVKTLSLGTFLIVDELHISCNRGKKGTVAVSKFVYRSFASLLLSGTPFRNKEERLFTVHDWLFGNAGNYDKWLHEFCNTEPDRFSYYPKLVSFKAGGIEEYLRSIDRYPYKKVYFEVREMDYRTKEEFLPITSPQYNLLEKLSVYGTGEIRIANSVMRKQRYLSYLKYCDRLEVDRENDTCILLGARQDVADIIRKNCDRNPIIYSQSSKVADLYRRMFTDSLYIDGKTSRKEKDRILSLYKQGGRMLFATDSVSTGTDGLQDATDCIVILYDTDDDTSRDQLIGRIAGGFRNKGNAEIIFITIT